MNVQQIQYRTKQMDIPISLRESTYCDCNTMLTGTVWDGPSTASSPGGHSWPCTQAPLGITVMPLDACRPPEFHRTTYPQTTVPLNCVTQLNGFLNPTALALPQSCLQYYITMIHLASDCGRASASGKGAIPHSAPLPLVWSRFITFRHTIGCSIGSKCHRWPEAGRICRLLRWFRVEGRQLLVPLAIAHVPARVIPFSASCQRLVLDTSVQLC